MSENNFVTAEIKFNFRDKFNTNYGQIRDEHGNVRDVYLVPENFRRVRERCFGPPRLNWAPNPARRLRKGLKVRLYGVETLKSGLLKAQAWAIDNEVEVAEATYTVYRISCDNTRQIEGKIVTSVTAVPCFVGDAQSLYDHWAEMVRRFGEGNLAVEATPVNQIITKTVHIDVSEVIAEVQALRAAATNTETKAPAETAAPAATEAPAAVETQATA